MSGAGRYEVKIDGNLTSAWSHEANHDSGSGYIERRYLRAVGKFSIDRDDFKVKATSAFHGLVRVRNKVKFEFDIVGRRS